MIVIHFLSFLKSGVFLSFYNVDIECGVECNFNVNKIY